jgi:DNA-binding CsgD family transcriptional regulator
MMRPAARDWSLVSQALAGRLTVEEEQIVALLANGKTQAEIALQLHQHRSRIWRKVRSITSRLRSDVP